MAKENTSYLGIRLDTDIKDAIERYAARDDRSVSNWVTRVLVQELKRLDAESR